MEQLIARTMNDNALTRALAPQTADDDGLRNGGEDGEGRRKGDGGEGERPRARHATVDVVVLPELFAYNPLTSLEASAEHVQEDADSEPEEHHHVGPEHARADTPAAGAPAVLPRCRAWARRFGCYIVCTLVERAEVHARGRRVRVVGAERGLPDGEAALVERLSLGKLALRLRAPDAENKQKKTGGTHEAAPQTCAFTARGGAAAREETRARRRGVKNGGETTRAASARHAYGTGNSESSSPRKVDAGETTHLIEHREVVARLGEQRRADTERSLAEKTARDETAARGDRERAAVGDTNTRALSAVTAISRSKKGNARTRSLLVETAVAGSLA